jgi:hypothetical protein
MRTTIASGLILLGAFAARAGIVVTLNNGGQPSAEAFNIAEWDGVISEDTPGEFAVVTDSQFCQGPVSSPCVSFAGIYYDGAANAFFDNYYVVTQDPEFPPYDISSYAGPIGYFQLNPCFPAGATVSGGIEIAYDLFNVSPNDPNFDPVDDPDQIVSLDNQLTVSAEITTAPEPSALALAAAGLVPIGMLRKARR